MNVDHGIPLPRAGLRPAPRRDASEIVRLHVEEGLTMQVIGDRLGITRERVRQLLRREGVTVEQTRAIALRRSLVPKNCERCGKAFVVRRAKKNQKHCSRTCAYAAKGERTAYPGGREGIIAKLRELAERIGRTPASNDLNSWDDMPSHSTVVRFFGSMSAAQEAAGFVPNKRGFPWMHHGL